jgi:hypothetical protein
VNGFVNGLSAPPVLRIYPKYEDIFYDKAGAHTFTVPRGAKAIEVTVIGAGGGGQEGGVTYGNIVNAYPGGGGGGGSGEIKHVSKTAVSVGASYALTVGAGGAAYGGAGGASSFSSLASAAGGNGGERGGNEPLNNQSTANGGAGGHGGIGGNGGGAGRGQFSTLLGANGANGADGQPWSSWTNAEWYAFRDPATGKRLGMGGRGGDGYAINAETTRAPRGISAEQLPGTMYGSGGRGGDQKKTGNVKTPAAGENGLVAIRVWYK